MGRDSAAEGRNLGLMKKLRVRVRDYVGLSVGWWRLRRNRLRAVRIAVLLAAVAAAIAWSAASSTPGHLPGASLGWRELFYVERAGALLGAAGVILLIGWRALHNKFPIKFGNIEYADEVKASAATVEAHEGLLKAAEAIDEVHERVLSSSRLFSDLRTHLRISYTEERR